MANPKPRKEQLDDDLRFLTFNAQTGTTYTFVLADGDGTTLVTMSNASANTITVPPNSSVAFPVGTKLCVIQKGAGATTVTEGAGVTINVESGAPLAIGSQYGSRVIIKEATDTWYLI